MAPSTPVKKSGKRTKTFYPGERFSVYFSKEKKRIRIRVFPSTNGYKVTAIRYVNGKTDERSVETFANLEFAKLRVDVISKTVLKDGWQKKEGAKADNLALFA